MSAANTAITVPAMPATPGDLVHADLRWRGDQAALSGSLLSLYRRLDAVFARLGSLEHALEIQYPVLIGAEHLARLDYFRSFPHMCTFACNLDRSDENLKAFARGPGMSETDGGVSLTRLAPVTHVLTPAACYHVYVDRAGDDLPAFTSVTTRAACFRRETYYAPLERQWSFGMREVVGLGTADEVKGQASRQRRAGAGAGRPARPRRELRGVPLREPRPSRAVLARDLDDAVASADNAPIVKFAIDACSEDFATFDRP